VQPPVVVWGSGVRCLLEEGGVTGGPGGDRVVGVAGARVDDHDMGAVGEVPGPGLGEVPAVLVEHGDDAGFGGDVEAVRALVVGEDIGSCADPGGAGDLPVREVDGEQGGVVVAGDEREPRLRVEGESVVVAAAGKREPAGDVQGFGVDGGEIALPCTATRIWSATGS
jgi:hypothetical protein